MRFSKIYFANLLSLVGGIYVISNILIFSIDQEEQGQFDNSVYVNVEDGANRTLDQPETPENAEKGVIERLTLDKGENNEEMDEVQNNHFENVSSSPLDFPRIFIAPLIRSNKYVFVNMYL